MTYITESALKVKHKKKTVESSIWYKDPRGSWLMQIDFRGIDFSLKLNCFLRKLHCSGDSGVRRSVSGV